MAFHNRGWIHFYLLFQRWLKLWLKRKENTHTDREREGGEREREESMNRYTNHHNTGIIYITLKMAWGPAWLSGKVFDS